MLRDRRDRLAGSGITLLNASVAEPSPASSTDSARRLDNPKVRAWILWSGVVVFTLLVRLRTLEPVETTGDPFEYVLAIKQMLYRSSEAWNWTHHTARFGMLLPSALVFWIFGPSPLPYYVIPLACSLASSCLLFATMRRIASVQHALLVTAAVVLFPMMIRAGSQLAPTTFLVPYMVATAYAFVRHTQAQTRRASVQWLVVMSVMTFAAYMTKVTAVFGAMGFAAALLLVTGRLWAVGLYLGVFAGLYGVEWLAYVTLSDLEGGRLSIITTTHLSSPRLKPLKDIWELLERFRRFRGYWLYLFAFASIGAVALAVHRDKRRSAQAGLMLVGVALLFGMVLGLKSFDPIVPAVPLRTRYATTAVPFLIIGGFAALSTFVQARLLFQWTRRGVAAASGLALAVGLSAYPHLWNKEAAEHPIPVLLEQQQLAWHHASKGTLVLGTGSHKGATKVLKGYLALFWPYHADTDKLPNIVRYRIGHTPYYFFSEVEDDQRRARRLEEIGVEKAVRELGPFMLIQREKAKTKDLVRHKGFSVMQIDVFEHGGTGGGSSELPPPDLAGGDDDDDDDDGGGER